MESRMCMNSCCGAKTTVEWRKGWATKSGDAVDLCFNCGSAYDNSVYCDTFHVKDTGWRECSLCNKRLHCGCIASLPFLEIQDFGGVWCITCARATDSQSVPRDGISCQAQTLPNYRSTNDLLDSNITSSKLDSVSMGKGSILSSGKIFENTVPSYLPQLHTDLSDAICGQLKPEANSSLGPVGLGFPNMSNVLDGPTFYVQPNEDKNHAEGKMLKNMQGPQIASSNINLHSPIETENVALSVFSGIAEDKRRPSLCQSGQKPRHIFPKSQNINPAKVLDANKIQFSQMRVARPPAEGRLRNQLLPRYWPRITDQELEKLSGDLNSTIVPLFEKILSASDASRIGRVVLPKACAEAYFPPIYQSEGLPLKIQDVKGNEWTFQFRFWPNNNSRMYVLEGVTPCIQSMELQAGDTVTFSRIDPGGKLVIGYRKASLTLEIQDTQTPMENSSSPLSGESFYPNVTDGLATGDVSASLQPMRGAQDDQLSVLPRQLEMVIGKTVLNKCGNLGIKNENALQQPKLTPEKKRTRIINSKSRRLILHKEDAIELRLSWEETQGLLRPPPCLKPNIVLVEDTEFEEYSEPPVFGKRTYFTTRLSGVQDQWALCDRCSKWRKLPAHALLPPKWTCAENAWDFNRSSCDSSEEMSAKELESVFRINKDFKKGKVAKSHKLDQGCEPSGLDALATAATLDDHVEPSAGATTRHPRHRPGCSCIVCIQPPSGKGKHKSSCVCNVCLTVKRRFKTLMTRKKKRQGDCEAELALQKGHDRPIKRSHLVKNAFVHGGMSDIVCLENDIQDSLQPEEDENGSKGPIDLNCHPLREEDAKMMVQLSTEMTNFAQATEYMKPSGIASLLHKQETDDGSSLQQTNECVEGCFSSKEECHTSTFMQEGDDQGSNSSKYCNLD